MATDQESTSFPDYLLCPVCHGLYKKPMYLPCLHAYCEECFVKLQVESDLTCIACKKTTSVPCDSDELKALALPNHTFFTRLADEIVIKQKIERNEEVKCTVCIKNLPAISFYVDCAMLQCKNCTEFHANSRSHQGHNAMQLKEIQSNAKDLKIKLKPETALYQYDNHGLELNFYCEACKELICLWKLNIKTMSMVLWQW